jgi:hypothetical protein
MPSRDSFLHDSQALPGEDGQWSALTDDLQLALAREALRRAAETLAEHAELLALEMETGALRDQGGPEALRLFAAVVRATTEDGLGPVGHA